MSIHIDISAVKVVNEQLPPIIRQVTNVKDILSGLRPSVDARVLDCSNLKARLRTAQSNIEAVECDLLLLHRTVTQNITIYEENEMRLNNQVQSLTTKLGE